MYQYKILKELGNGSFGRVMKVIHQPSSNNNKYQQNSDVLAMKQIKMMQLNSKEKNNALNEVRLLASIDSPYIIKYKCAFIDEMTNLLCIVMEYADGGDLKSIIDRKRQKKYRFTEAYIWKMAYCILKGLQTLHSNGIIHRDIKAANIFLVNGDGKLGDLNVSTVLRMGQLASTQTGTPYYTSPQIWCNRNYDAKCDIWSLGCLIYQMCMLKTPFLANDIPSLCHKICHGQYPPLSNLYSSKMTSFINLCLKVNHKIRPSVQQLLRNQIFQFLGEKYKSQVDLLKTIKCPKSLKMLNRYLPQDKFESNNRLKTLKIISQKEEQYKSCKQIKSMKKIGENIFKSPIIKQKQNLQQNKYSNKSPLQLPKVVSNRNIII